MVLVQLPNCLPFATVVLGTWAAGLTATLVSPALTSKETAWVLKNSRPRLIITAKPCLESMRQAISQQEDRAYFEHLEVFVVDVANDDTYPRVGQGPGRKDGWRSLLSPTTSGTTVSTADAVPPEAALSRAAVMLWSSGTSGTSKGVLLSHNALNFSVASLWHDADYYDGQPQRWLGYVPLYHVFGLSNLFLLSVATGTTVYTMPAFKLDAMLAAVPKRKITYLHMAPPVAVMLAKSALVEPFAKRDASGRNAFASVVAAVTGGAPLGHEIVVQVYRRLGFLVRMGYGLSEACNVTVQGGLGEEHLRRFSDSEAGYAHWGVKLMIDAKAAGEEAAAPPDAPQARSVPTDMAGEILIQSPGLMMGYLPSQGLLLPQSSAAAAPSSATTSDQRWPDMSATSDALTQDGWLRTGDVGTISADGILRITDRIKEMIKVRAFQVAPAELEALLCGNPDVADAGVVGIYDKSAATEFPRAYVVPADVRLLNSNNSTQLHELAQRLKHAVETHTARYKWLVGGLVFVSQIPKSPSGKILRRVMKEGGVQGLEVSLYQPRQRDQKL